MGAVDYDRWRMENVLQEEADLRQEFGVGSKVGGSLGSPRRREDEMGGREPRVTMSGLRARMSSTEWHTASELAKLLGAGDRLPGSSLANTVRGCAYALVQAKIAEVHQRLPGIGGGRPSLEFRLRADASSRPTPGEMTTKEARSLHPSVELRKEKCVSRRITRRADRLAAPAVSKEKVPAPVRVADPPKPEVWELEIDSTPVCVRVPVPELLSFEDVETMYQRAKKVESTLFGLGQKEFVIKLVPIKE